MINKNDIGKIVEVLIDSPCGGFISKGSLGQIAGIDKETGDIAVEFGFEFIDSHTCDGICAKMVGL